MQLAAHGDVEIVYPVHLNPHVRGVAARLLGAHPAIHLIDPLDYLPFVNLMRHSALIMTDSGGVQKGAPSLGKPVLVTSDTIERRKRRPPVPWSWSAPRPTFWWRAPLACWTMPPPTGR